MLQERYMDAEPLLAKVLEREKDDLEAGINMAIVEINTNKIRAAQTRLSNLKTIYDTDTSIPELIRKIEKKRDY
jgi:thioredoxin-like negative regulator of GroEL